MPIALRESLPPAELQILEVKYQSAPFCQLLPEDVELWADALLLKIHAITGWAIPEKTMQTVFTDQFRKKIIESYPTCNPDEVEYAFRNYGTMVQDWGKQMNLSLIDQVMIPYLARRAELSKVEEQKTPAELPASKEDLSDKAMADWLEHKRKDVQAGGFSFAFLPIALYDWLSKKGKLNMSRVKKAEYVKKAVEYRRDLYVDSLEKFEDGAVRAQLRAFNAMVESGEITGGEIETVEGIARRMILFNYLKTGSHDLDH